jgi:hypothetical protein
VARSCAGPVSMTSTSRSFTVEEVAIDQLRPDPANPRRIREEELESLTRSLRQFGFVRPVLARKQDGVVIGGHQRLVAARVSWRQMQPGSQPFLTLWRPQLILSRTIRCPETDTNSGTSPGVSSAAQSTYGPPRIPLARRASFMCWLVCTFGPGGSARHAVSAHTG